MWETWISFLALDFKHQAEHFRNLENESLDQHFLSFLFHFLNNILKQFNFLKYVVESTQVEL